MIEDYSEDLMNCSRADFLVALKENISKKRFKHVLRVEEKALQLAERFNGDLEIVSLASLLHDFAKEMSEDVLLTYQDKDNFDPEWLNYGSAIWHGPLAAYIGRDRFNITNPDILGGVWGHTIGKQNMTLNQKILFVADYIEDGRDFPGVDEARALAEKDLDAAVNYKIKASLALQIERENLIYPETIIIYNDWMEKKEN
ncbi:bis(5'-nucleosyl)-tetraphosphatase (symmetrical) YqeK [Aerococcus kribbianus]|uniref:bis(5'-nucleosyl)-tetraphosphatase (symmetrical) n=1 Tax=Aerococcus kribbianus TaxID=2999064 RepID=A0A9X3JF09_9LACT|nr:MULTISPECIES: bis(5'-nucleosyl)-tetraphosphatase (symmetrical) YqeK [unclassified Aerococcus]MCZ0717724.1 bis(5'-nucleosyl)-tetraphosphatase (symmetrical) YqeK [Aerococcus sp. YH-aer221]MCZ0726012.1 bis(5'-nucleosyl)-tetraphosphatase (symmetrical) YqeK [Aerococcus sp. YH-aer222]